MAALDFPANPAVDQTYGAPSGVTYKWTGTLWVAVGGSTPPPGGYVWDARATSTTTNLASAVWTKLPFNTLAVEQAGVLFNTTLNRVAPPAGLYSVTVQMRLNASGVAAYMAIQLYKNGAPLSPPLIPTPIATAFANKYHSISATWLVQLNGTDYIEAWGMQTADNAGTFTLDGPDCLFTGFAISGVKGAPGEPYPGTVGGDFCATNPATFTPSTSPAVVANALTTLVSGNSGNWFNPATGRFTPPAGRYFLWAVMSFITSAAAAQGFITIYKNGVPVSARGHMTTAGASYAGQNATSVTVDANGTDYFEMFAFGQSGGGNTVAAGNMNFGAFPISGVKGPPGDPYPGTVGGDFFAQATGAVWAPPSVNTWTTAKPPTVVTGNSGNWYNQTTGVFTPPAGRHRLFAGLNFYSTSSGMTGQLRWRKNGATMPNTDAAQSAVTGRWAVVYAEALVDANGTDTFDLQVQCDVLMSGAYGYMGAFPTTGVKGPPGDPGQLGWRLLNRQVLAAAAPTMDYIGIPNDINDIEFRIDATPVSNATGLVLQWYDGTGALINLGYGFSNAASQNNTASAGPTYANNNASAGMSSGVILSDSRATRSVRNTTGIRARGTINNIRSAGRSKSVDYTSTHESDDGVCLVNNIGGGWRITPGAITGLRVLFGIGNIAAGSVLSVWGSP